MTNLKKLIISASMAGAAVVTLGVCGRAAADDSPRPRWDPDTGARRRSPEFVRAGGSGGINRALAAARNARPADAPTQAIFVQASPAQPTDASPMATTSSPPSPSNNTSVAAPPPAGSPPAPRVAGASEMAGLPESIRSAALQEVPGASISTTQRREESGTVLYEIETTGGDQPRELLIREDGVILRNSRVPQ